MTTATLLVMFLVTYSSEGQDIHTVSKISVQKHQTIIIPCLYDQKYVGNPKYVSSGGIWLFSTSVTHDRMSVVDKQTEKVFTATLRNAEVSDTGTYWCGISKSGYDPAGKLKLEVLEGKARLHVSSQSVSGYEGGNAVVVCHGASQWCQIGRSCVGSSGGTSDKTVVHISGDALNVTLSELKREDSGWYFCSDGESQMPVHITVKKAPYTRRVTVQNARQTPESGQDEPMGQKRVLWLVVLGVMLFIITCAAVILVKANYKRKQTAETSNPCEGMNNQELRKENEENEEDTCDKLYKNMSGMKQNIQEKEKNDKVACENLYEKTGMKQNIQENEEKEEDACDKLYEIMSEIKQNTQENKENEEVACDKLYEIMSGMKQNIQGNERNCQVENLYEIMTGIEQNMQTALDNKNIYESMVRKVK